MRHRPAHSPGILEPGKVLLEYDFNIIAKEYSCLIRSAIARVAGPETSRIVDDVEQNVLISLWKAMQGEQKLNHPSSYLYRAAVRETVRAIKGLQSTSESTVDADRAANNPKPDALLEAKELGQAIRTALSEIGKDRMRAVTAHLAGYDVKEIMAMYAWPYHKTRNLIARGMADVRKKLATRGYRD